MARQTILVVDDSPTSIMWQQMILGDEPYEIITATDGVAGVQTACARRPDLILMEVAMPRMNGPEACRAIRANPATQNVPILMVTTHSELSEMEASFASGCNEYITKPITRSELLAKVHGYLRPRAPEAA
jgi:CheY-like chemotaxis protein